MTPYRLEIEDLDGIVEARFGDVSLVASSRAKAMHETRLPVTVYFPMEDLDELALKPSAHKTFCPFKGTASYWDLELEGKRIENAAWSYKKALPESKGIEGMIGFMPHVLDKIEFNGKPPKTTDDGHIAGPLFDWLMREAAFCKTPKDLAHAIGRRLIVEGVEVSRMSIMIWSLHPEIVGANYIWEHESDEMTVYNPTFGLLEMDSFTNSPLWHVSQGRGGVRRSLQGDDAEFDFPILADLKEQGASEYVAMPLPFSGGQINVLTLTTDHPKGFTTANLGMVFELAFVIARFFEVFTLRRNATSLLETYLGKRTGARVLGGEIRRGDGEDIDAAILICDLRNSTSWEEALSQENYLKLLNGFFETVSAGVEENDGEILKFIGDAVLAIFPATDGKKAACERAIAAALAADKSVATLGAEVELPPEFKDRVTAASTGVAFGNVTYGNVGSKNRLDFTVIGHATNVAARLSDLGKSLGCSITTTKEVSDLAGAGLQSKGFQTVRGVDEKIEVCGVG